MGFELNLVRVHDLAAAVLALLLGLATSLEASEDDRLRGQASGMSMRTIDVGFGALTGSPLALTGARVPAFSAFLCSRWTCGAKVSWSVAERRGSKAEDGTYSVLLGNRHRGRVVCMCADVEK
jgi:hypothetical protein